MILQFHIDALLASLTQAIGISKPQAWIDPTWRNTRSSPMTSSQSWQFRFVVVEQAD
jgi:hypothetical protein